MRHTLLHDDATRIFVWSRLAIWVAALLAFYMIPNGSVPIPRQDPGRAQHDLGSITDIWARWDSDWFLRIAQHGYGVAHGTAAFYPLYPGLVAVVGRIFFGHYVLAGLTVSLAAALASFILLERLAERLVGAEAARRATLLLAVFPMSLFLQAVYGESVFLVVALAAFLAAENQRFALAGVFVGLSLLARPTGVAVLLGVAVLALRKRPSPSVAAVDSAKLLLAVPIFGIYPLVLHLEGVSAVSFLRVEALWDRRTATLGPLGGLWDAVHVAWASVRELVAPPVRPYWSASPKHFAIENLEVSAFFALFVALSVIAWRRLGAPYGVMALVAIVAPVAEPTRAVPLLSMPRFGLVVFPLFIALATLCTRPSVERAVISGSAILLGVTTTQWALWQWVS